MLGDIGEESTEQRNPPTVEDIIEELKYLIPLKKVREENSFVDCSCLGGRIIEYSSDELKPVGGPVEFPYFYETLSLKHAVHEYIKSNGFDANAFIFYREESKSKTIVELYKIGITAPPECVYRFLMVLPGSSKKIPCIVEQDSC
ncbi:MAG: hypothetical protein U9Q92_01460 [archaeon]|nr:hypothetical protein [archaeon]